MMIIVLRLKLGCWWTCWSGLVSVGQGWSWAVSVGQRVGQRWSGVGQGWSGHGQGSGQGNDFHKFLIHKLLWKVVRVVRAFADFIPCRVFAYRL
jgi:hypothetical protein